MAQQTICFSGKPKELYFISWMDLQGKRRELTLNFFPLTSTPMPQCQCPHTYTHKLTNQLMEILNFSSKRKNNLLYYLWSFSVITKLFYVSSFSNKCYLLRCSLATYQTSLYCLGLSAPSMSISDISETHSMRGPTSDTAWRARIRRLDSPDT